MENHYEEEISLGVILFKVCQQWRILLIFALAFAIAVGGTRFAIDLQGLSDSEKLEELKQEYTDTMAAYEAEGDALKLSIAENQRNLQNQTAYNNNSMLMKVDPQSEWNGSINFYIETHYQVMPNSSIQNENPAYRILCAYADYYNSGELYTAMMGTLSFDMVELKYLQEILKVNFEAERYAFTVSVIADTKEHCDELLRIASEAFRTRYSFVENSLGEHELMISDAVSYAQINIEREMFQRTQEANEKALLQSIPEFNNQYRAWLKRESSLDVPVVSMEIAVKGGIKWIVLGGLIGFFLSFIILFVKTLLSKRVMGSDDLGVNAVILAELPTDRRKRNVVDRLICHIFGVTTKASEYDSRVKALVILLEKYLVQQGCSGGTVAFVGDVDRKKLESLVGQVGKTLPDRYKAVAAGNLIADGEAAETAYGADAVLLVAEQDISVKKTYTQINDRLTVCKTPVLGTVLLGVESL